jgi:hypothetical protein
MTNRTAMTVFTGLVLAMCVTAGCSQERDKWRAKRPRTYRVSGVVTTKGQPVDAALVTFWPADGSAAAVSRTDEAGRFSLRTFDPDDGAVAGIHRVLVEKVTEQLFEPKEPDGPIPAPVLTHHLPEVYRDRERSPLTATVSATGKNDFPFELSRD